VGRGVVFIELFLPTLGPIQMNHKAELVVPVVTVEAVGDQEHAFPAGFEVFVGSIAACETCELIVQGKQLRLCSRTFLWYRSIKKAFKRIQERNRDVRFTWAPSHPPPDEVVNGKIASKQRFLNIRADTPATRGNQRCHKKKERRL
jgi:hypothetical protein